ncbi:hypothetical protein Bhyg_04595, partial [Pseudolycoriella hygida]
SENVLNGNAMTASSKISAINLVAELLRKVNIRLSIDRILSTERSRLFLRNHSQWFALLS